MRFYQRALIAVLLGALSLGTTVPGCILTAQASDYIEAVEVKVTVPQAGEPIESASGPDRASGASTSPLYLSCKVTSVVWKDPRTESGEVSEFEAGKSYVAEITLKAPAEWLFNPGLSAKVDDGAELLRAEARYVSEDEKELRVVTKPILIGRTIESVMIRADLPVGDTVYTSLYGPKGLWCDGFGYDITSVDFIIAEGERAGDIPGFFETGMSYYLTGELTAREGYVFSRNTELTVNDWEGIYTLQESGRKLLFTSMHMQAIDPGHQESGGAGEDSSGDPSSGADSSGGESSGEESSGETSSASESQGEDLSGEESQGSESSGEASSAESSVEQSESVGGETSGPGGQSSRPEEGSWAAGDASGGAGRPNDQVPPTGDGQGAAWYMFLLSGAVFLLYAASKRSSAKEKKRSDIH